jgi:hypothetical protein
MPAYSGSLVFSTVRTLDDCVPGDIISFRLISEYLPASNNYTASITEGSLVVDLIPPLNGAFPFATSSAVFGNFITSSESPNVLVFNSSLSNFVTDYIQMPIFSSISGSTTITTTSSLYSQYGDIRYPLSIESGDKVVMYGNDGRTQELIIVSTNNTNLDNKFRITVQPNLDQYFIDYPERISSFLIVKRVPDEQNIILRFKKPAGATSYGFVISDDVDPNLVANISTIQANVQNQLLSTQENTG